MSSSDDEQQPRWGSISALFAAEADHIVSTVGAIDPSARRDAVSLVLQFDCNLDPFVACLAINYIDRYLSKREIPIEKPWIVRLLSISCLSLASKMKETCKPLADFLREKDFVFDAQTIRRMELLVLEALDWRMRSITPFSFLRFFTSFFSPAQPPLLQALQAQATQILLKTQNGNHAEMKVLEFKPSVVAASALLSAAYEFFPVQFPAFRSAVASCEFVNEEELRECSSAMRIATDGCGGSAAMGLASTSNTPPTVLRRLCSSSESEPVTIRSASDDRELKKRRTACHDGQIDK
ncbi:Cyclin, N-terminal domain [Musa troglodytarum]|uniref:Cyclin, N-terminal domain n=1 Tax=Musa troglodytarum TaxID=320322 RepID=A0A9E7L1T9_9LILI|nr:Cyclin, N-terminal domain [Musa troglodytarum]